MVGPNPAEVIRGMRGFALGLALGTILVFLTGRSHQV
jgi:hypothetical protein